MTKYNTIETFKNRVLGAGPINEQDLEILKMIEEANDTARDIETGYDKLSENYRLGNVSLTLDKDCNMIICISNCPQFDAKHDYKEGYKVFAKLCKQEDLAEWDIERFWGWAELGGGVGTPKDNGYDCKQAHCVYCD